MRTHACMHAAHTHTHTHTHTLSLSLSLSLTRTHTHLLTHTHSLFLTLSFSFFLAFSLFLSLSHSHSLLHAHALLKLSTFQFDLTISPTDCQKAAAGASPGRGLGFGSLLDLRILALSSGKQPPLFSLRCSYCDSCSRITYNHAAFSIAHCYSFTYAHPRHRETPRDIRISFLSQHYKIYIVTTFIYAQTRHGILC